MEHDQINKLLANRNRAYIYSSITDYSLDEETELIKEKKFYKDIKGR